jgi:Beta-lactamase enzyme family
MRVLAVLVAALSVAGAAPAGDVDLLAVKGRYLPAAQGPFANDPDGLQARYDAARELEEAVRPQQVSSRCEGLRGALLRFARAQVAVAEAADYPAWKPKPSLPSVPAGCTRVGGAVPAPVAAPILALPRGAQVARPEGAADVGLTARLAAIGRSYPGWAGFWVHDLRTGRTAGWNSDARFAAGSAVKLAPLVAAMPYAPLAYDAVQVAHWSSNLGANRIVSQLGTRRVDDALRRLGMWSSTYPGLYRAGTGARVDAPKPPPATHARVTTAHDLGRALYGIHAAAIGNRLALGRLGLSRTQARTMLALLLESRPVGDNRGLVRPSLPAATIAQKNAWISDLRTTAAIVYRRTGPTIVVVEVSRPGVTTREAVAVGRKVVRAVGLDRTSR